MATPPDQQQLDDPQTANLILLVHKDVLLYTTVGDYPEFETKRPLKRFVSLDKSKNNKTVKAIASKVIHIVIDPLFYDEEFLKLVNTMCVNVKRLTIDANLLEKAEHSYIRKVDVLNGEAMCRKMITFIAGFDGIEELYFGPNLYLTELLYGDTFKPYQNYEGKKYGAGSLSGKAEFYRPKFSTDIINNLNLNLKTIFFNNVQIDAFDLRDAGNTCPVVIIPMNVDFRNPLRKLKGAFVHTCLNRLANLRTLSINYFENCYHSDTVEELILNTLSGDFKVHEMFPNVKKLRVKMFCPFVMDMSGTGNAGLYDNVVLEELEVEEQIPCFCKLDRKPSGDNQGEELQSILHLHFTTISLGIKDTRDKRNCDCHCVDVAKIGLLKDLKVIKFRCFDATVARFISKLQESGSNANIIVYEKSRFERSVDHQSLWNNLSSLAETVKIVPRDKIELVMKKVDDDIKMKKIKHKLRQFIRDEVKITFAE